MNLIQKSFLLLVVYTNVGTYRIIPLYLMDPLGNIGKNNIRISYSCHSMSQKMKGKYYEKQEKTL